VYSALEADFSALMRYINSRFTYLLTYSAFLPSGVHKLGTKTKSFNAGCIHLCWMPYVIPYGKSHP